jgi:energy-converting hydrogenase Eha subunit F
MKAIKNDNPYNEVERGVQASVVTSMGRMAAHIGSEVTYNQMLNSDHVFGPGIENLAMNSQSPLPPNADGTYPIPQPGMKKKEY